VFHDINSPLQDLVSKNVISTYLPTYLIICLSVCLVYLAIHGSIVLLLNLGRFFRFLIMYTVGRTPWTGDQPVARPLPTQNKRTQTSMPRVGFEPTIPAFERAKTVHALDRAVSLIGRMLFQPTKISRPLLALHASTPHLPRTTRLNDFRGSKLRILHAGAPIG
jgi:hypothetical protein